MNFFSTTAPKPEPPASEVVESTPVVAEVTQAPPAETETFECVPHPEWDKAPETTEAPGTAAPVVKAPPRMWAYEFIEPTKTSDRICRAMTLCRPDQYEATAGTTTTDRHCLNTKPCPEGQFESVAATITSDRECEDLTPCEEGMLTVEYPTATADFVCEENITNTSTTAPVEMIASTNTAAGLASLDSGAYAVVVVVIVLAVLISLIVFAVGGFRKVTKGDSLALDEIPHETALQKGAIDDEESDDDEDMPYAGGEFYFLHEKATEVVPVMHMLRQPVKRAMVRKRSILDLQGPSGGGGGGGSDSEDSGDEGMVSGSYTVNTSYRGGGALADGGASPVKLLNQAPLGAQVGSPMIGYYPGTPLGHQNLYTQTPVGAQSLASQQAMAGMQMPYSMGQPLSPASPMTPVAQTAPAMAPLLSQMAPPVLNLLPTAPPLGAPVQVTVQDAGQASAEEDTKL